MPRRSPPRGIGTGRRLVLGEVELVGRDAELAVLARAVADVGGGGPVVAVVGEAGIGKTELLGALAEDARAAGLLVLAGRCAEHEREVPFALAVDVFDAAAAALSPGRLEALGGALAGVLPAAGGDALPDAEGPAERLR